KTVSRTSLNLFLSILGLLAAVCSTNAQTFTLIADNRTQIPRGTGTFSGFFDSRAIEQGTVVFIGFGSSSPPVIYSYENGQLSLVADNHTVVPGTTTTFTAFNTVDLEDSVIVFTGDWATGNQGVFQRTAQGALRALASTITTGKKYFQGVSM